MHPRLYLPVVSSLILLAAAGRSASAWTPATQVVIGREAARLAPPDLWRQIDKHRRAFDEGVNDPFSDSDPARHAKNPDGSGQLDRAALDAVDAAVQAIRAHEPFESVVRRLGAVSHYVADADNPLAASADDADEGRYFVDYLRYVESAEPRFPLVYYGVGPTLGSRRDVAGLLDAALRRGRQLYPMVGREYRRIDFASGLGRFDDRSTAFGVGSLAFSHAVTDVARVLRYIWLAAGGIDDRASLPNGGSRLTVLPRSAR